MAIPDIQDLHERYLRMLGGSSNSTESVPSEPRTQSQQFRYTTPSRAFPGDGSYPSGGGVLGALGSPSQGTSWWMQALVPPTSAAIGLRGPRPVGRFGPGIGMPIAPIPDKLFEIPNPHLGRFIPQSTRDIRNAAELLPWILRRKLVGDERSNETAEGQKGAQLSERSPEPPANRPGNQPPWIVGPAILEKARRREDSLDAEPQVPEPPNPDHRELTTVGPVSQEAGSASDLSEPSMIGWRKRRKKTIRSASPGGSARRAGRSAGAGNGGTGGKAPGRSGGDDDDYCASRRWEEENECHKRWRDSEYAHPDHYSGCEKRAEERWDLCNRNGGTPLPGEPNKWSMDPDEEVFINIGR